MLRWLTDLIYLVPLRARRFSAAHPDEVLVEATATKAVRSDEPMPLERGSHWALARRSVLFVTRERLVCGDWDIPFDQIASLRLHAVRSVLSRGYVLVLDAGERHYQFGLMTGDFADQLPIAVERTEGRLQMSAFSIAVRVALVVLLLYLLFT